MRPTKIEDIAKAINAKLVISEGIIPMEVTGAKLDSRVIEKGDLFIAINGERVDGHNFINKTFEDGAAAALCDHIPEGVRGVFVVVDDTVKAFQDLAEWYRNTLDISVVGISGSVGKTSTKEIVASVLLERFNTIKTIKNHNNELGVPLMICMMDDSHDVAVLELGISDFNEMRLLARIAKPEVCVLTNIGQSHLEALGTRDGILKAKTEMFEYRNPNGPIFLNGDDDKLSTIKDVDGTTPLFYGFGENMYAYAKNVVSLGFEGTKMTMVVGDKEFDARIKMIGNHMVANAIVASAIGEYFGMTNEEIAKGLENAETIAGRSNLIPHGEGFVIDDCYNAAPTSMKAAVDMLCLAKGRKVAVLGDMYELGKDTNEMHYDMGVYAAVKDIDLLICVGEISRNMYEGAKAAKPSFEVVYFENLDAFMEGYDNYIGENDNVLLKASNGMKFSKIVELFK